MRYLILVPFLLVLLFTGSWAPPTECADEDREMPGNRNTPCKLILPPIERAEYRFTMDYPVCREEMAFHMPGVGPVDRDLTLYVLGSDRSGLVIREDRPSSNPYGARRVHFGNSGITVQWALVEDAIVLYNPYALTLDRAIRPDSVFGGREWASYLYLHLHFRKTNANTYLLSNGVERPTTENKVSLANACLDLVRQEKQDREHKAAVAAEEARRQAELRAQQEKERRRNEQAKREAEAQARQAKMELRATLERRIVVAETELLRTETLVAEIKHKKAIGEILQDIVRIKLTGSLDRQRITNEYLNGVYTSLSDFDTEAKAIEAQIAEYVTFNEQLLGKINTYYGELESRIRQTQQSIETQKQRIVEMEAERERVTLELMTPPTTTTSTRS